MNIGDIRKEIEGLPDDLEFGIRGFFGEFLPFDSSEIFNREKVATDTEKCGPRKGRGGKERVTISVYDLPDIGDEPG